jgi:hypothetical protein
MLSTGILYERARALRNSSQMRGILAVFCDIVAKEGAFEFVAAGPCQRWPRLMWWRIVVHLRFLVFDLGGGLVSRHFKCIRMSLQRRQGGS